MNAILNKCKKWHVDAAGAGVVVALVATFYLAVVRPSVVRQAQGVELRQEVSAARSKASQIKADLAQYRDSLADTRKELRESPMKLQPTGAVNQRLAGISDLAAKHYLKINEIQPGAAVAGEYYKTVPIEIAGSGTYRSCTSFLSALRVSFADVNVWSIELACSNPAVGAATFRISLRWHAAL